MAKPLTDVQRTTLRDVRDGKVTVKEHYMDVIARLDVFGRLEGRGFVEVDWDTQSNLVGPGPGLRKRYPARITTAGLEALQEARDG